MSKSPYIPQRLKRSLTGANTGLGVNECWIALFIENERRHRDGGKALPRTDDDLTEFIKNEFPEKKSEVQNRPAKARWRYNAGRMYKGQKKPTPAQKSFRYDSKGNRVPSRFFDPETD